MTRTEERDPSQDQGSVTRRYHPPRLLVYGQMRELTAAGSGEETEFEKGGMGVGGMKKP